MRWALAGLLAVHGAIHVLGVLAAWRVIELPRTEAQTTASPSMLARHVTAAGWSFAAVALIVAGVLCAAGRDSWWLPATAAVVLSQILIVLQWQDAKAGTIANVLVALALVPGIAIAGFHAASTNIAAAMRAQASPGAVVTAAELAALPAPVQRWLQRAGVVGRPRPASVDVSQRGQMRTAPDGSFFDAAARQTFRLDQPAFVWAVDATMGKVVPIVGRDSLLDGRGHMLIRAAGLVTVADATGDKIDQGTLVRFLTEMVWFPAGALAPYITWRAIDEQHADATIAWRGVEATARFAVDAEGRVTRLQARRWLGDQSLQAWEIPISEWRRFHGVEVPSRGTVAWKLAAGDFEYYRWEILDVVANPQ